MQSEDEPTVCPICQGKGFLVHVDEEVCCQVEVVCWACSQPDEKPPGQSL
jgi:hypothetical protein